jgi:SAM-dependent methyltransferase
MSKENQITLRAYEKNIEAYVERMPHEVPEELGRWLDEILADVPTTANILELGSAYGRDAAYIESLGYRVERTDAAQGFVDLLRGYGFEARNLNAITNDIPGPYDFVLASTVLLHFTRVESELVSRKVFAALNVGGKFALSLIQGEGEEWAEGKLGAPRFFCYWTAEQIGRLLTGVGFSDIEVSSNEAGPLTFLKVLGIKK